ncbi:protein transporter [Reticulomyxa filosa]|uniref:Protein transporter n=1 Tax=Reticulomyxa filosa TaxID=46433 RepID=X6MIW2_RETFI|nr:protein transporter [Reticulomyxa filosa]|eukprot:ETO13611.1 protein transporter [Reticulomyxa filosa]
MSVQKKKKKLKRLREHVEGCFSDDVKRNFESCTYIRKLLANDDKMPTDQIIASGVVKRLVDFCRADLPADLQLEAAWALTNIVSGDAEHTASVIRENGIPALVNLLETTKSNDVFEQALWALGNISGDSAECRNLVLNAGALDKLIPRLHSLQKSGNEKHLELLGTGCWVLSNFCRGKPPPPPPMIAKCIAGLLSFLVIRNDAILQDAAWGRR